MNFPEIGSAHTPEIEISKNFWMSFPGFANKGYQNFETRPEDMLQQDLEIDKYFPFDHLCIFELDRLYL